MKIMEYFFLMSQMSIYFFSVSYYNNRIVIFFNIS